jgi:hypothetical protein
LRSDVGGRDERKHAAVGIFYLPRRDKHWQAPAAALRQEELVLAVPCHLAAPDVFAQRRDGLRRIPDK